MINGESDEDYYLQLEGRRNSHAQRRKNKRKDRNTYKQNQDPLKNIVKEAIKIMSNQEKHPSDCEPKNKYLMQFLCTLQNPDTLDLVKLMNITISKLLN